MKNVAYWLLLATCLGLAAARMPPPTQIWRYQIEPESKLFIAGSSNVVSFTCACPSQLPGGQMELLAEQGRIFLTNAVLKLPVKGMDCGNRVMNNDMYATLEADQHPYIRITLREVIGQQPTTVIPQRDWAQFTVVFELTVAGTTRTASMTAKGTHLGGQRYRFSAQHRLRLTDFNITPPTAMLGAVKVKNEMTIHADLVVALGR